MSAEQKHTPPLNTPIKLSNNGAWPFDLVVLDAAGVAILSERRAAHSSRDRTVDDLMDAVHFHREGREAAREANHEQLARWEFIVAAVNSFASSQERIAQLEAVLRKIEGLDSQIDASPRGERKVLRGSFANIARAALGAQPLAPEPEGWKLVPFEPTEAMIEAYCERVSSLGFTSWANASTIWPAMLAAAPERIVGAAPEPEGEWIDWDGGECPVPRDTPVTVSFRTGYTCEHSFAYEWVWSHSAKGNGSDIIAYRVVGAAK